jgi:hypothetical protein
MPHLVLSREKVVDLKPVAPSSSAAERLLPTHRSGAIMKRR